jgi:predicted O-linked N-acetylglucosamine transferase (SPINDLY family)
MSRLPAAALIEAQRLHRAGQHAAAAARYEEFLRLEPRRVDVLLQLGLAWRGAQRPAEALQAFDRARQADPRCADAHQQAGLVLKRLGRLPEALVALQTATALSPHAAPAWLNLGAAHLDADQPREAVAAFRHALALEPQRAEAHNILGVALTAIGDLAGARQAFGEALRLKPAYAAAHNNLGRVCKMEGAMDQAVTHYRAALALEPHPGTHSNLLLALNYVPDLAPAELFAEHRRWNALHAAAAPAGVAAVPRPGARRLRLGYFSPDFNHHAVSYFIAPVLAAHDRSRIEVFCYANLLTEDHVTARLRGLAEHWCDISRLDDAAAAERIRRDELDLLVDLAGHTARNRLLVFARRPARVQATWIGYPNTTGMTAMDYRITDAVTDPRGMTEAWHSERLVRLAGPFSCYEPDAAAPAVSALPADRLGTITFGCFNNFAKVSPPVFAAWSALLAAVPGSQLLLKSRGLADPATVQRVHAGFARHGVRPERIHCDGRELSVRDHLSLYHDVDVALDPFPYNGTTTTCEALWMGVPVVTLAGGVHASRVGASLLTHVGLPDWIAGSVDDYVRIAVAAVNDRPRLARLRATLRDQVRQSPLCDAPGFTRNLEDVLASLT